MRGVGLGGLLLAGVMAAQAGQPLQTNDADIKGVGDCEWESGYNRARSAGDRASAWTTQLGCGTGAHTEWTLGVGHSREDSGDRSQLWSLSGKWGFRERTADAAGLALAWSVMANDSPGVPPRAHGWLLTAVATQPVGEGWLAHGNLGLAYDRESHRTHVSWAAAVEHAWSESLDLTAETFGFVGERPSAALGLRWRPAERWTLGAAYLREIGDASRSGWTATVTLAF